MTDKLGVVTMPPPVRRTINPANELSAANTGRVFQRSLVAELESALQHPAAQTSGRLGPAHLDTLPGTGDNPGSMLTNRAQNHTGNNASHSVDDPTGNRTDNSARQPIHTPLYERLYGTYTGTPLSNIEPAPSAGIDSVSANRIRNFADRIRTPASIAAIELGTTTNTVIAFAGLESGWGQHVPAAGGHNSHNLFGIKSNNHEPSVTSQTTEFINGQPQTIAQSFRSYRSIGDSIADFSHFLRSNPRYEEALNHAGSPKRFIQLVHAAGYATDPDYANKVIGALEQLDKITRKFGAIGIGWK